MIIHTDHFSIKFLINKPTSNHQIVRWLLLPQEFDIIFVDKPKRENVIAYIWRRLQGETIDDLVDDSFLDEHLFTISTLSPWFIDITNYLVARVLPQHLIKGQKENLIHKRIYYTWKQECLYKIGIDLILQRFIQEDEVLEILRAYHTKPDGGHYGGQWTAIKILNARYYWLTIFKDSFTFVKTYDVCQRLGKCSQIGVMSLQPIVVVEPFNKWGLDFIGPIHPPLRRCHQHILVCTDYCTKWTEVRTMMNAFAKNVTIFLYEKIFTRYGIPRELVSNRRTPFVNKIIKKLTQKYQIRI